jgi:hypothetical protein
MLALEHVCMECLTLDSGAVVVVEVATVGGATC